MKSKSPSLARGVPRTEAIVDAGRKRARPIVMTTIAMVGGMLPAAIGLNSGGEFRAPMAVAVIGGLISSTGLSLVFVPALFVLMDDVARDYGGCSAASSDRGRRWRPSRHKPPTRTVLRLPTPPRPLHLRAHLLRSSKRNPLLAARVTVLSGTQVAPQFRFMTPQRLPHIRVQYRRVR